ncbi:MAG: HTH domain-containing protein [Bacilli bacterium]|nr:HTH domain-containing protein [Bacilli bacterium]
MDERNKLILLYDYYGELLSDSQKRYFEDYYFNNLSLGEISEELSISRNAVHKQIKSAIDKLLFYEEKLKIISKNTSLINKINELDDIKIKDELIKIIEG